MGYQPLKDNMKLLNIYRVLLSEGLSGDLQESNRVRIPAEVNKQVNDVIDNLIPKFFGSMLKQKSRWYNFKRNGIEEYITTINYNELGDSEPSTVKVFLYYSYKDRKSGGYYDGNDPNNKHDNVIMLNMYKSNNLKSYEAIKEAYRDLIIHELTHAMDPKINSKSSKVSSKYQTGTDDPRDYEANDIEVLAQQTSFFHRIIVNTENILKKYPNNEKVNSKLITILDNILNGFNTGNFASIFDDANTKSFIGGVMTSGFVGMVDKVLSKFNPNWAGDFKQTLGGKSNDFEHNLSMIYLYKEFNPKAWKKFLSKLYSTINEAKSLIEDSK